MTIADFDVIGQRHDLARRQMLEQGRIGGEGPGDRRTGFAGVKADQPQHILGREGAGLAGQADAERGAGMRVTGIRIPDADHTLGLEITSGIHIGLDLKL